MGKDSTKGSKKRPSAADDDAPPPPKAKKMKQPAEATAKTKGKAAAAAPARKAGMSEGEYFELSPSRRLTIESFKGLTLVNIREYYKNKNTDGEMMMPGKKGISLPVAQFQALVALLPEIEAALAARGEVLGRPEYGAAGVGVGVGDEVGGGGDEEVEEGGGGGVGDEEDEEEAGEEEEEGKRRPRKGKVKENFEATSEEEEEGEG